LLCRSAGGHLKEQQMFATRLAKARQRLARLQAQAAAGTFMSRDVIQRRARQAVGRPHDLRGIFAWDAQRAADGQELRSRKARRLSKMSVICKESIWCARRPPS
jgi:hypothetical protein